MLLLWSISFLAVTLNRVCILSQYFIDGLVAKSSRENCIYSAEKQKHLASSKTATGENLGIIVCLLWISQLFFWIMKRKRRWDNRNRKKQRIRFGLSTYMKWEKKWDIHIALWAFFQQCLYFALDIGEWCKALELRNFVRTSSYKNKL